MGCPWIDYFYKIKVNKPSMKDMKIVFKRHNRKANYHKVKKEHIKFIKDEIMKNKTIIMKILLEKLNEKFKDLELTRRQTKIYINFSLYKFKLCLNLTFKRYC